MLRYATLEEELISLIRNDLTVVDNPAKVSVAQPKVLSLPI